ncbi:Tm-1-like ATP-binding domain-containing protein [Schlesneria sp. T3-172]|uniref:Tm-1-like ATP-binding domain-containing protein n=1 Tax=Schlesneria sphaerica TaxID=3373610 RepID=UPI0037CC741F
MTVYLLGTLDTKGAEVGFLRDLLHQLAIPTCIVDTGCLGEPVIDADISRHEVFQAAEWLLDNVRREGDRGKAVSLAALGATRLIREAHARGEVDGIISLGGSAGTSIGTSAMRALPLGVPKLMISTLASGQTRPYVGSKDILMMNAVVDIAGINRISRVILTNAAHAMAGMVRRGASVSETSPSVDRPLIAATMFGVTTPCVERARQILEAAGYEVLVFHATGTGGEAMEGLIADGLFAGVLDITTTELADELVGGTLTAGPTRLTAAGRRGVPQVISVGALDMVNFGPRNTVPDQFKNRQFYEHNATVTLMRTTVDENRQLGAELGRKAAAAKGPTAILFPQKGVSAIDQTDKPFDYPEARQALLDGIRSTHGAVELMELDHHINDTEFAEAAARKLLELIR